MLDSLAEEGFEMEEEHRISYYQPENKVYVHLGRTGENVDQLLAPEAFNTVG